VFFFVFLSVKVKIMPFRLKKILIFVALLLVKTGLYAQIGGHNKDEALRLSGGSIYTSVPFLIISPDARSGAMGDAGVASSPDVNSQHWNAAKYAFIEDKSGVSLTYSPWLRVLVSDMNLLYLSGFYRIDEDWIIGSSLRFFSLGRVVFRSDAIDAGVPHHPNEYALDASISRKLSPNFSLAVAARYIRSDLTSGYSDPTSGSKATAANSGAVDVGMFYHREITTPNTEGSTISFGLNISNVGAKVSYSESMEKDFLPQNLRFGGSYSVQIDRYNEFTGMVDFNKLLVPTPWRQIINEDGDTNIYGKNPNVDVIQGIFQSFYDAPGGWREELHEINISVGLEYWYNKTFAFRGGYFHESAHRVYGKGGRQYFTLGAGLRFNVFEVDFSYLMPRGIYNATNPLRNTLRFTLTFNLGEYRRRQNQNQ
jgi:hypothetical protein